MAGDVSFDVVSDFVLGQDKVALVASDFGLAAGAIPAGDFVVGAAANAAHEQFVYDAASKTLFWDVDGTGAQAAVAIATFNSAAALNLQATDLLLI